MVNTKSFTLPELCAVVEKLIAPLTPLIAGVVILKGKETSKAPLKTTFPVKVPPKLNTLPVNISPLPAV